MSTVKFDSRFGSFYSCFREPLKVVLGDFYCLMFQCVLTLLEDTTLMHHYATYVLFVVH